MAQNTWDRFAFDCPYQIKAHAALRTIFEEKESTPFGDEQQPLTPADVSYSIFDCLLTESSKQVCSSNSLFGFLLEKPNFVFCQMTLLRVIIWKHTVLKCAKKAWNWFMRFKDMVTKTPQRYFL